MKLQSQWRGVKIALGAAMGWLQTDASSRKFKIFNLGNLITSRNVNIFSTFGMYTALHSKTGLWRREKPSCDITGSRLESS